MKILRICRQGGQGTVCETDKDRKIISKMSLNELCTNFDWDYKKISNKDAKWFD
jgi:hypothetical protein